MDKNLDVINYSFNLLLNDSNNQIKGKADITFRFLTRAAGEIILDLVGVESGASKQGMIVNSVSQNNTPLNYRQEHNRLKVVFARVVQPNHQVKIEVAYQGIPQDGLKIMKNCFAQRTFFADNWPDRASHWLPCIDHPSDKASCDFLVTAPAHYQVVANGILLERRDLEGNLRLTHWQECVPIATKLMVIGVSRFAVNYLNPYQHISIQNWVFPQSREQGFIDFAPVRKVLKFFQYKIGPYAYNKIASVQSTTRYGGMENASTIFYHQGIIRGKGKIEELIAHEMAHQWFGDSVSERDWHHVWLSEGFATYFTTVYLEFNKDKSSLKKRMKRSRQQVISYARKYPFSTIVDKRIKNINKLLNTNSYEKGAWLLHMLRKKMGDKLFFKGIQLYYQRYKNMTALSQDFQNVIESVFPNDLHWFFNQWLYGGGIPCLKWKWSYLAAHRGINVLLEQIQPSKQLFRLPLEIGIIYDNQSQMDIRAIEVTQDKQQFFLPVETLPEKVVLDPGVWTLFQEDQVE